MDVKCPQHDHLLTTQETVLRIGEKDFACIIGLCPQCNIRYINRQLFQSCNIFRIDGIAYQYLRKMHTAFPFDEKEGTYAPPAETMLTLLEKEQKGKLQKVEEKKKKLLEKRTANARKELAILNGNPKHIYRPAFLSRCKVIPEKCPEDGRPLTLVHNVHYGKWHGEGYCCIYCSRLFQKGSLPKKLHQKIIKEDVIEVDNHPMPSQDRRAKKKKAKDEKPQKKQAEQQATNAKAKNEETIVEHLPDSAILVAKIRRLDMKAERTVAVVTDAEDQYSSSGIYWIGRSMSAAVLSAIQIDPQCHFEHQGIKYKVVSYEGFGDLPKYLRIISRFCDPFAPQTIHIFAHKIISKFQGDDYETVTAMIPCADKAFPVATTVYYEKKTSRYFMNEDNYKELRDRYGLPHLRLRAATDVVPFGDGFAALKPNSELNLLGYNVNATEGLTTDERRKKLGDIIDSGVLHKVEVMNHIEWCIKSHKNIPNHENAVSKWREDLLFVQKYKANAQRIVWIKNIQSQYTPKKSL